LCIHGASVANLFGPEGSSHAWRFVGSGSFFGNYCSGVSWRLLTDDVAGTALAPIVGVLASLGGGQIGLQP
jgi:hypothetical protein